jgi:hypothetical protein
MPFILRMGIEASGLPQEHDEDHKG